jgi:hypothetical protein
MMAPAILSNSRSLPRRRAKGEGRVSSSVPSIRVPGMRDRRISDQRLLDGASMSDNLENLTIEFFESRVDDDDAIFV